MITQFPNYKQMISSKTTQIKAINSNKQIPSPGITKFATLTPYLAQIEKRKKTKLVLRENRSKSKNESSSKSFRIKQRSTSSLHNQNKQDLNNKTIISIISKFNARKKQENSRNKRIASDRQKPFNPTSAFTTKTHASRTLSRNDAIDVRQKRPNNDLSFRKNKYQSKSRNQVGVSRDKNKETLQVSKYGKSFFNKGYTDTSRTQKQQDTIVPQKQTENMYGVVANKKNKFRRGKYEALYSSVNSNDINQQKDKNSQPAKSESRLQFTKKQSYLNIDKDIDESQDKQMQKFYRQIRSREIEKSLQKSTQKYFKEEKKYRVPKTNNDIQIYVSTIKDPTINRQSNASTLNTSQKQISYASSMQKPKVNNYLNYDFDYKQVQNNFSGITEIDNPSQQQSMQYQEQSSFDRQRKEVQKQYFHKKTTPKVDWSEQDCQIDDV